MFGIVLTPFYKAVLIIAAVVAVFGTGYYKGYRTTQDKFDTYKAEVAAIGAAQEAKTQIINDKNKKVVKETANAYKTNLSTVREYYDRLQHNGSEFVSTVPNASRGTNANPSYNVLAGQCAETTLQVVSLQNFIKSISESY